MKQFFLFTILLGLSATNVFAQETTRERFAERTISGTSNSSVKVTARAEQMNRSQSVDIISDAK